MANGDRAASTPAAGAMRVGIGVTLGNLFAALVQHYLPDMAPLVAPAIVTIFAALAAAGGKALRNRGNWLGEVI